MGFRHVAAGLVLGLAVVFATLSGARAETRTLKLYFVHTKERAEITFKKDGRYIKSGLDQLNRFLRDWRRGESTNMDPRLMDLLWEVYRASGSREYIHVLSAYRAPATNKMLRSRSKSVAENSLHMRGKAIDFYLPDVKLVTLRNLGLKMQVGGVGYYPRSGSPFVHLDVGSVRHWPRLSRQELAQVFPDGKTVHIPADGKPMPGYQQALAELKRRGSDVPIMVADDTTQNKRRRGGLLAFLFGGGQEEADDLADAASVQVATAAPARRQAPAAAAAPAAAPAVAAAPVPPVTQDVAALPSTAPLPAPSPLARQMAAVQSQEPAQAAPQVIQPPAPGAQAAVLAALPATVPLPQAAPRRSAQPEAAAVAAAPAAPDTDEVAALLAAANVPLPTPRPASAPVAAPADEVLVASVDTGDIGLPTVAYAMPSRRPDAPSTVDAIANLLAGQQGAAPALAEAKQAESVEDVVLAAYASEAPAQLAASSAPVAASAAQALTEAKQLARPLATSPKVAPKGGRPSAQDLPKVPKPHVKPVTAKIPEVLLEQVSVARAKRQIEQPAYSPRLAEAPTAVYTMGFTHGNNADPRRFSGKAVEFMAIAKFQ